MKFRRIKPVHLLWIAAFVVLDVFGLWFWIRSHQHPIWPDLAPHSTLDSMVDDVRNLFSSDEPTDHARKLASSNTDDARSNYDDEYVGNGRLDIRVVDETTNEPLADTLCVVYAERNGERTYAKCVTDADGRASAEHLPVNTILVEARRTATHAAGFAGVWLKRNQTRDVVIRVGPGGTAIGRVVDDTGAPIAGAEIMLGSDLATRLDGYQDPRTSKHVAVISGPDGRFEIAHLSPRPWNVWIVDGEMRPEGWGGSGVYARKGGVSEGAWVGPLKPHEIGDFGDIVIERSRTWRGHVVDARGARVEGALVTLREDRNHAFDSNRDETDALWPGQDGFRLEPGEVLTAADGSFAIEGFDTRTSITIWPRTGIQEVFRVASLAPGATSSEIELRLNDWSMLEVELVDAQGNQVLYSNPRFPDIGFGALGAGGSHWLGGNDLGVVLTGARETRALLKYRRDGVRTARFEGSFDGLNQLRVAVPGYFEAIHTFTAPIVNGQRVRLALTEPPTIRLHVTLAEQDRGPKKPRRAVINVIRACLLSPEQRHASNERGLSSQCCGFDCELQKELPEGESDVELPALTDKPLWIYLAVRGGNGTWFGTFGPFAAGPTVHAIDIPKLDPSVFFVIRGPFEEPPEPTPPPRALPPTADPRGALEFRVVDANSGEPLPFASATVITEPANRPDVPSELRANLSGRIDRTMIPVGSLQVIISAGGHASSSPISVAIRANETTNLGSIALEALPPPRIQVLHVTEADGTALADHTQIEIIDPRTSKEVQSKRAYVEGINLSSDVPERFLVTVTEYRIDAGQRWVHATQVIAIERDSSDVISARLEPWCAVEVEIGGAITEFPRSGARVTLRRSTIAADPETQALDTASTIVADELEPMADGRRRFRALVTAGSFAIEVESVLCTIPATAIEVRKLADLQTFELSSTH